MKGRANALSLPSSACPASAYLALSLSRLGRCPLLGDEATELLDRWMEGVELTWA